MFNRILKIVNISFSMMMIGLTAPNRIFRTVLLTLCNMCAIPPVTALAGFDAPCQCAETSHLRPLKCLRATERHICSYKPLHRPRIYYVSKWLLTAGFGALAYR